MKVDDLWKVRTLITHAGCPDGLASAMIVQDALPHVDVRFLAYKSQEHEELEATEGMLFVDFVPPRARVDEFVRVDAIVLDHHKDNQDIVLKFGDRGVFADEKTQPGIAGANLAYEHVWKPLWERGVAIPAEWEGREAFVWARRDQKEAWKVKEFAELAGIRDTFVKTDPRWMRAREYAAALLFYPREHWLGGGRLDADGDPMEDVPWLYPEEQRVGELCMRRLAAELGRKLKQMHVHEMRREDDLRGRLRVAIINDPDTTDLGDLVCGGNQHAEVLVGYRFFEESVAWSPLSRPRLRLSFRSESYDVSRIARLFGGGGHTSAAGATVTRSMNGAKDEFPATWHDERFATFEQEIAEIVSVECTRQEEESLAQLRLHMWGIE